MQETISADDFVARLRRRQLGDFDGGAVQGRVDLSGEIIEQSLALRGITFHGEVDFSDCRINGSLYLDDCTFARCLKVFGADIDGNLSLRNVLVKDGRSLYGRRFPEQFSVDARCIKVGGEIDISFLQLLGTSTAAADPAEGSICLDSAQIGRGVLAYGCALDSSLLIRNATIGGSIGLGSLFDGSRDKVAIGRFREGIDALNIRVDGDVRLTGISSAGGVCFSGARIQSSFLLDNYPYTDEKGPQCVASEIRGSLDLDAACVGGHILLRGASIHGPVDLTSTEAANLGIEPKVVAIASKPVVMPCSVGSLDMRFSSIRGAVQLEELLVTGASLLSGTAVRLSGTKIGSHLRFWRESRDQWLSGSEDYLDYPFHARAFIGGHLQIDGSTEIGGTLDITNIVVDGEIIVRDSHVAGDVKAVSSVSLLNGRNSPAQQREIIDAFGKGCLLRARARYLDLSMLTCDNDIDLTGLMLLAGDGNDLRGDIVARDLTVKGSLELQAVHRRNDWLLDKDTWESNYTCSDAPEEDAGRPGTSTRAVDASGSDGQARGKCRHIAYCSIPGVADFRSSRVGTFRVSAHSFDNLDAEESELRRTGLRLSGATIGDFQVIDVLPGERTLSGTDCPGSGNFFPVPIDLRDITVEIWSVGRSSRPRAERYLALLENDKRLRRSTYRDVERSLRNRGHSEDANAVYRRMRERSEEERRQNARTPARARRRRVAAGLALALPALALAVLAVASAEPLDYLRNVASAAVDSLRWLLLTFGVASILFPAIGALLAPRMRYLGYRYILGFGSAPLRVVWIIIALWVLMLPGYAQRENFEPSLASLSRTTDPPSLADLPGVASHIPESVAMAMPPGKPWPLHSAFFYSLNHHVPMLGLLVREDWELRGNGTLVWRIGGFGPQESLSLPDWVFGRITPEDWGVLMSVVNWVLWPLVLTFGIRKAVRGNEE